MSRIGTQSYNNIRDIPAIVTRALLMARQQNFSSACLPAQGRLLQALAAGVGPGVIGEIGTGCGVGLAWLASAAHPKARLISIEIAPQWAQGARQVFAEDKRVSVLEGDWLDLRKFGPFDLLFLDGAGDGKGDESPITPSEWMSFGGTVVVDDLEPLSEWPPRGSEKMEEMRRYWLTHPELLATEIRHSHGITQFDASFIARYVGTTRP
jgi:predicted O-methyltransferase YrrM